MLKHGFAAALTLALGLGGAFALAESRTITGEVIDIQCYTKDGAKGTGEAHADCAKSCAKRGMPVGILASDGVYEITGAMTQNKNEKLIEYVAKKVEATGEVTTKDGKKTIDVASMKPAN
jgi:hypothetical protein